MTTIDIDALLASLPRRISDIPGRIAARDPGHMVLVEDDRRWTRRNSCKSSTKPPASYANWACAAAIA